VIFRQDHNVLSPTNEFCFIKLNFRDFVAVHESLPALNVTCRAAAIPPLLGDKRTLPGHCNSVARDPKRAFAAINCRIAKGSFAFDDEVSTFGDGTPMTEVGLGVRFQVRGC